MAKTELSVANNTNNIEPEDLSPSGSFLFNLNLINMKTVIVAFTSVGLTQEELSNKKWYAFNTNQDFKSNQVIIRGKAEPDLIIVAILNKSFKYYHKITGDLSDMLYSTNQRPIKPLKATPKI